jgi:thiol-disulfide isomerase/thioredoxin
MPNALLAVLAAPGLAGAVHAGELRPWTGGATPALVLKDIQGREHRLADYRGKVVLVNFWATWCEPCREEMPSLERLRQRLGGSLVVLAVDYGEGEARVGEFLARVPVGFPVLLDRDMAVSRAWKARALPTTFVVDSAGTIRYSAIGELDWSAPAIEAEVRKLLQ